MRQKLCDHEWAYAMRSADHIEMDHCTKCGLHVVLATGEDMAKPEDHV